MRAGPLFRSIVAALPLVVACASEVPPATPSAPPSQAAPRETWARLGEVESWPAANDTAFSTRGHLVKPSHAIVRVSPDARSPYLALVTDTVFPDGTLIAMFHQSRDGSERGSECSRVRQGHDVSPFAVRAKFVSGQTGKCR